MEDRRRSILTIANVPQTQTEDDMRALFGGFGPVRYLRVLQSARDGKNVWEIGFEHALTADSFVRLYSQVPGTILKVSHAPTGDLNPSHAATFISPGSTSTDNSQKTQGNPKEQLRLDGIEIKKARSSMVEKGLALHEVDDRPVLMIRNIPDYLGHDEIKQILQAQGLLDKIVGLRVPVDPKTKNNLGYFFVHVKDAREHTPLFIKHFMGREWEKSNKITVVCYARTQILDSSMH